MKQLLQKSINEAMSYSEYNSLFESLVANGKTTGEETQEKIEYTKLNYSRTKRLDKTAVVDAEIATVFGAIENPQTWLVISEPWCGDAAQTLPFLNKISELTDKISLKIVLRDAHLELMDHFLTNGSRSIPMVIMIDENLDVIRSWGPRSKAATKLVEDYKKEHGKVDDVLKQNIQVWYNKDKGTSILKDLSEIFKEDMVS